MVIATVRLRDLRGVRPNSPGVTTAHAEIARFYRPLLAGPRRVPSVLEQIVACRSLFQVGVVMADAKLLIPRTVYQRNEARWREAARVRRCELRGWLP